MKINLEQWFGKPIKKPSRKKETKFAFVTKSGRKLITGQFEGCTQWKLIVLPEEVDWDERDEEKFPDESDDSRVGNIYSNALPFEV
jgi:hypothetical protein